MPLDNSYDCLGQKNLYVSQKVKFRHGALGRYLQRLIIEDIAKREKLLEDELLGQYMTRPKEIEE